MFNNEPKDYSCPLCTIAAGKDEKVTKQSEVIFHNKYITAFIAGKWWLNTPGHVIIIPNKHYENLYDMPDYLLHKIISFSKKVAIAFKKVYKSDGTSIRQHNEPAGNQEVWHYHYHVFPRYKDDKLYQFHEKKWWPEHSKKIKYAKKLKSYFKFIE